MHYRAANCREMTFLLRSEGGTEVRLEMGLIRNPEYVSFKSESECWWNAPHIAHVWRCFNLNPDMEVIAQAGVGRKRWPS